MAYSVKWLSNENVAAINISVIVTVAVARRGVTQRGVVTDNAATVIVIPS